MSLAPSSTVLARGAFPLGRRRLEWILGWIRDDTRPDHRVARDGRHQFLFAQVFRAGWPLRQLKKSQLRAAIPHPDLEVVGKAEPEITPHAARVAQLRRPIRRAP